MVNTVRKLVLALALAALLPGAARAGLAIGFSVNIAPPPLPVYVQPPCPAVGYIWTPGYWAWSEEDEDYFWVPGTWVMPPTVGFLWTPGYWGWDAGVYLWHAGYWGPHVGFYGGINYGFGYTGVGFAGGFWRGDDFVYNRAVTNVTNINVTNVYNNTVVNNVTVSRTSFNGGQGGVAARPTAAELAAANERHVSATSMQAQHQQLAMHEKALHASVNSGKPPIAATQKPAVFSGHGVVAARGAPAAPAAGNLHRSDRPNTAGLAAREPAARGLSAQRSDRPPASVPSGHAAADNGAARSPGSNVHERADRPQWAQQVRQSQTPAPVSRAERAARSDMPPRAGQRQVYAPHAESSSRPSPRNGYALPPEPHHANVAPQPPPRAVSMPRPEPPRGEPLRAQPHPGNGAQHEHGEPPHGQMHWR